MPSFPLSRTVKPDPRLDGTAHLTASLQQLGLSVHFIHHSGQIKGFEMNRLGVVVPTG